MTHPARLAGQVMRRTGNAPDSKRTYRHDENDGDGTYHSQSTAADREHDLVSASPPGLPRNPHHTDSIRLGQLNRMALTMRLGHVESLG